ncbi:sporulation membrane protein YtaF [Brevibacterium sp. JNUCC-42]|nr:sporulation membrane protein YtaF [Brevibacterium sp. JNUCC-42]
MGLVSLLLICLAVSLDGFGVGMSYGLRKMNMPFPSFLVISLCSFAVIFVSMTLGHWLQYWVTPELCSKIGATVLILIGGLTLWKMLISKRNQSDTLPAEENGKYRDFRWTIRMYGLMIHILRDPERADTDRSGHIVGKEAIMLGLALSLDAFGSGVSLTLLGFAPLFTSLCVALTSIILLWGGMTVGRRFSSVGWFQRLSFLPAILLIGIGFFKW